MSPIRKSQRSVQGEGLMRILGMDNKVYQEDENYSAKMREANGVEKVNLDGISNEITLTWEQINVTVPDSGAGCFGICKKKELERKEIIQNVSGIAKPGQLLAIMGASGAGKTTLLNVLNYRNRGNLKVSGVVKCNGNVITSALQLASISGYVQQDDLFIGTLTVKEHLKFQAMLRMDRDTPYEQRLERVEEILNDLNLKKCENTLIGVPAKNVKGISGGEKRRLGFATEVITNPALLFCDEPTSGLDSFMAVSIVDCMKKLALQGKTIICTIHQPSSEIFEMFDRLCLLAEGRLAYLGDLPKAYDFFASQQLMVPENYNPADFYIQKLAIAPTNREECKENVQKICDSFAKSPQMETISYEIDHSKSKDLNKYVNVMLENKSPYKSSSLTQLKWLFWRSALATVRDPLSTKIQILQTIMIAVIFGLIFLQQKLDQDAIQNINGVIFLCITNASFSNLFNVVNSFPPEIPIFLREHYNGMYRVVNYYVSKLMIELPGFIITPIIFLSIVYWMSNLNNDVDRFFICCFTIVFVANVAASFGTLISAASPSTNVAMSISAPVLVPLMIFGGFFLNNDTVPKYFIWIKYLSWIGYANEILSINQWEGVTGIKCPNNTTRCYTTGDEILKDYKMEKDNYNLDFILMGVLYVSWRLLSFLLLLRRSYAKK